MNQARTEYLEAKRAVDACFDQIEMNKASVKATLAKIADNTQPLTINEINYGHEYIKSLKIKNERLQFEAKQLLIVSDQKHEVFLSAQMEKKIAEKLIEKEKEQYIKELKDKENKEREDIVIMRSRRSLA